MHMEFNVVPVRSMELGNQMGEQTEVLANYVAAPHAGSFAPR
jgi:hypothetical protein